MKNLTLKEYNYLKLIIESDFQESENVIDVFVWSEADTSEKKGCASSCYKKGYLDIMDYDKNQSTHAITKNGLDAFNEFTLGGE